MPRMSNNHSLITNRVENRNWLVLVSLTRWRTNRKIISVSNRPVSRCPMSQGAPVSPTCSNSKTLCKTTGLHKAYSVFTSHVTVCFTRSIYSGVIQNFSQRFFLGLFSSPPNIAEILWNFVMYFVS